MTDYKKLVEEKEAELSDIYSRMKTDRDLVNLVKQNKLTDVDGKPMPHTVYVTLNRPAVFDWNVRSALGKASERLEVTTEDKKLDTSYIEDFIKAGFRAADRRLTDRGSYRLNEFLDEQFCRRGRGAVRCLFQIKETKDENGKPVKVLMPDFSLWDTLFYSSAMGVEALDWAAYRCTRKRDEILSEYPDIEVKNKKEEVLDIWTTQGNIVYVGDQKILEQEHKWGFCPVAQRIVPLGSMGADEDSYKYHGESIFFLIRDLESEINDFVSIVKNMTLRALDRAKQFTSDDRTNPVPDYEDTEKPGTIVGVGKGAVQLMPLGEIQNSALVLQRKIDTAIEQGTMSDLLINGPDFEMSAVALLQVGEGAEQVFMPRLGSRGVLKQYLAEMMIAQTIQQAKMHGTNSVELGARGHKRTFDVSKLEGAYDIEYFYHTTSPSLDAARVAMAGSYGNLIPDKSKRREILMRDDPDEDERILGWEEAERLSPRVKLFRRIRDLAEEAERGDPYAEFEAELLCADMGVNLEQMLSGQVDQTPQVEEEQKPTQMVNMWGKSSAKKSAEIQATPEGATNG
jgi:hypothetical protein